MYKRMYRRLIFMVVLLILLIPQESNASLIEMFQKLAEVDNPMQMSPTPSPVSSNSFGSGGAGVDNSGKERSHDGQVPASSPKAEPVGYVTNETCEILYNRWCRDQKNMTACLPYPRSGPQGSFLLVQNDGEISLKVEVTFVPVNNTSKEIEILRHQAWKINISANVDGSSLIVLNAGNGDCVIHMGGPVQQGNFFEQFPYSTYVTPINGVSLLFATALIIGGTWACCKLGKRERHLDGGPYRELEMGQPESHSSMNVERTTEGWDQGWDDDWDEEKAVKSPGGNHMGNGLENGHTSRSSNTDGWGNDWDD